MSGAAYGRPLLRAADGTVQMLDRLPVDTGGYDEAYIQRLAFAHPECLPIAEIDTAYKPLIPVCMELGCTAGYLDALYVTPTGRLAILEAKLWRNPEARRKVVAQILDYARELSRWSYEDLQRELSRHLKRPGNVLYQLAAEKTPGLDEAAFVDAVTRSLRTGRFLLLIVGDGIREGAGAIAGFLQDHGSLEFTFGLVELALYSAPDDAVLVQPRVIARSEVLQRIVVSLPPGATIEEDPEVATSEERTPVSDPFYQRFWSEFLADLHLDDPSQPLRPPAKGQNQYFGLPPRGNEAWVSAYFNGSNGEVGVFLRMKRSPFTDRAWERFVAERGDIETALGVPVDWRGEEPAGKYTVLCPLKIGDVKAPPNRAAIQAFLADRVNRFVNVFRPRLEKLSLESTSGE